ncbi:insulinase family protein, partial [bacterium]|nr:insulinase family protein [bacterium]
MTRSNLDIRRATLPGGSRLLINADHRLPICTVMVWFEVGSRTEKNGQSGISHYLEHCYSMGTNRFKPRENSWIIQRLGGTKNAFTSHDYTAYYSQVPFSAMEMVIDMEADRFYNLALPENMVTSEKEVIKEEKRLRYEDAPMGKLYEHVLDLAYENHPYKNLVIGSWDDLDRIGRDDLMAYYRQQYVSNKMTLVISGDGDPDAWQVMAERYFG